ncbi:MAG: zinc-ribbon domain-containing protein [Desulfomonile sp.]|nr:zinc-ribbon domain-containing protein [Desulfomonile sp.]
MIVKCAQCGEKMRVDDNSVPPGRKVKLRCPHCQAVGVTWLPARSEEAAAASIAAVVDETKRMQSRTSRAPIHADKEPHIPADAFNNFRFPSEEEGRGSHRAAMSWKVRLLLWGVASGGVILFFALLVNLVLPGPPR